MFYRCLLSAVSKDIPDNVIFNGKYVIFGVDNIGTIGADVLGSYCQMITREKVDEILSKMNTDGYGSISYEKEDDRVVICIDYGTCVKEEVGSEVSLKINNNTFKVPVDKNKKAFYNFSANKSSQYVIVAEHCKTSIVI